MTTALHALTPGEVEELLESYTTTSNWDGEEYTNEWSWDTWAWETAEAGEVVPHLGTVKVMDTYRGGEGGGEDIELVFEITFEDGTVRWFRKTGYYQSYDGSNWDGAFKEVRPVQRMVTFYE